MAMTAVKSNTYNYTETKLSDNQVLVTNNLGRAVVFGEFVYLGGYFGFVEDYDGIANGAAGYISIGANREVSSEQVEATDTFVVGNVMYFVAGGSSAAGKFTDAAGATGIAVGTITGEEGTAGAQTSVRFRPYLQKVDNANLDTRVTALEGEMDVEQADPKIFVQ